jgi:hypothetical protein
VPEIPFVPDESNSRVAITNTLCQEFTTIGGRIVYNGNVHINIALF